MAAHRYWRIYCTADQGNGNENYCSIGTIELHTSIGGAAITGGTASADSTLGAFAASNAFDAGATTMWISGSGAYPHWIAYDYGAGNEKDIVEFAILGRTDNVLYAYQSPRDFQLQYSNDGSDWSTLYTITGTPGLTIQRTFSADTRYDSGAAGEIWRIYCTAVGGGSTFALHEVEMRATAGGADQCTGGTVHASSTFQAQNGELAFDSGTLSTSWWACHTYSPTPGWLAYHFASAVNIKEIALTARTSFENQAPVDFLIQRWDGSGWVTVRTVTGSSGWTSGETRLFDVNYAALSGEDAAGAVGSVTADRTIALTGVSGTGAIGSVAAHAPHRYWRVKATTMHGSSGNYMACQELRFLTTYDGVQVATGGTAISDSAYPGLPASNAFDGTNGQWASNGTGTASWIGYDFGVGNAVAPLEVWYTPRGDSSYLQIFTEATLDYSDDGSTWTPFKTWTPGTWGQGNTKALDVINAKPADGTAGAGSHRYWRVLARAMHAGSAGFMSALNVEWRLTAGGSQAATGGTPLCGTNFPGANYAVANAYTDDANDGTLWASYSVGWDWIGYDFGSAKQIAELWYKPRNDFSYTQIFTEAVVQSSDDGSTWTTAASWTPSAWAQNTPQTFTIQDEAATALTQVSGTGAVGTVVPDHSNALTGTAGEGAVGTPGVALDVALTGVAGEGAVGTVTVPENNALTQVAGEGVVGSVTPSLAVALTGVAGVGAVGTATPGTALDTTGTAADTAVGTMVPSTTLDMTGVAGSGAVGSVTAPAELIGVTGTGAVGTVTVGVAIPLAGVSGEGAIGTATLDHANALAGAAGVGAAGTVAPETTTGVTGTVGAGEVGSVAAGVAVALAGASAAVAVGTPRAEHDNPLTGVAAVGAEGSVQPPSGLSGVIAGAAVGSVASGRTLALTQAAGTGEVGTVAPGATTALSGVSAGVAVGSVAPALDVPLSQVAAAGAVGELGQAGGVTGVAATVAVGSVSTQVAVALTGVSGTGAVGLLVPAGRAEYLSIFIETPGERGFFVTPPATAHVPGVSADVWLAAARNKTPVMVPSERAVLVQTRDEDVLFSTEPAL